MAKGFSYREGMQKLLKIAMDEIYESVKKTQGKEKEKAFVEFDKFITDLKAFNRVTKALCSKAKRADKKALKALAYLREAGAITPAEYQEKIQAVSGLDDDVLRATQWPRGVLEVVSKVIEEALETLEEETEPKAA